MMKINLPVAQRLRPVRKSPGLRWLWRLVIPFSVILIFLWSGPSFAATEAMPGSNLDTADPPVSENKIDVTPYFKLPANRERQSDASKTASIESIIRTTSGVKGLTCTLKEKFFSSGKNEKEKIFSLWLLFPDKRKKIQRNDGEFDRIDIEDGKISWNISNPKSYSKVVWENQCNFIPSPILKDPVRDLKSFEYFGTAAGTISSLDTTCHIFSSQGFDYLIGADDGIIRQRIQKPFKNDKSGTVFCQTFSEISLNPQLDEKDFSVKPRPGSTISETVFRNGQKETEESHYFDYQAAERTEEDRKSTLSKLTACQESFLKLHNFSCKYKVTETRHYERIGRPPGTGSTRIEYDPTDQTNWKKPQTIQEGKLIFEKPSKIAFFFDEKGSVNKEKPGRMFISDGEITWVSQDFGNGRQPGETQTIVRERIADKNNLMQEMAKIRDKQLEIEKRFRTPGRGPTKMPPPSKNFAEAPFDIKIPQVVLEPYNFLDPPITRWEKDETLDGDTPCSLFSLAESDSNRKMEISLGTSDGIPRRIKEYDWMGNLVETEIEISEVRVDQMLGSDTFSLKKDDKFQVMDSPLSNAGMMKMLAKTFDVPPEDSFKEFFLTPISEITELRGSGAAFMGAELYIRFKCTALPKLKDEQDFSETDPKEMASWFSKMFLEDEPVLRDLSSLKAKKMLKSPPGSNIGKELLWNPSLNLYFFRYWHAH